MKKLVSSVAMVLLLGAAVFGAQLWVDHVSGEEANSLLSGSLDWTPPDLEYLEYYGMEEFHTTLPVVFLDTHGNQISKENKIWATMSILNGNGAEVSIMDSPQISMPITLKYRGASSYSRFDKKSYRIKTYSKKHKQKEYPFLDMGTNTDWVLNGPFLDKTLTRNKLVYDLGREIMEWAPDSRYFELFIDGKYQGVYLGIEPVTNGESRLRLSKFSLLSGKSPYIVKRDRVGTEDIPLNVYGKTAALTYNDLYLSYPPDSRATEEQIKWVTEDISAFERALYSDRFDGPAGYAKYIDIDNFVDYYIINEVFMNNDAGNLSTYAYKELDGKLNMAIWDYNNCLDNYQWFDQDYKDFFLSENSWFSRLIQDRGFVDRVVQRYRQLRQTTLSDEHVFSMIEKNEQQLGEAIDRNFAIWGYVFHQPLLNSDNQTGLHINAESFEEAKQQLQDAFTRRTTYLDYHIESLYRFCVN